MKGRSLTKRAAERKAANEKSRLKVKYGLTLSDYNKLYHKQKGCCAICGTHQWELNIALHVDHDHETGKIRGLLCGNCNHGLGCFKDSRGILIKAIQYLGKRRK